MVHSSKEAATNEMGSSEQYWSLRSIYIILPQEQTAETT